MQDAADARDREPGGRGELGTIDVPASPASADGLVPHRLTEHARRDRASGSVWSLPRHRLYIGEAERVTFVESIEPLVDGRRHVLLS